MDFNRIRTDTWSLSIPSDWIDKTEDDSRLYFESPDQTMGCYVTVVVFSNTPTHDMHQRLASGKEIKIRSLKRIGEGSWVCMTDVEVESESQVSTVVDHYNESRNYRIVDKIVANAKTTIFLSCHDYYCEDYLKSKEFFSGIVDSFECV